MFLTDYHDMEMMLISEDEVISSFLFEYTSLTRERHSVVRSNIMTLIEKIGLLKWLNEKEHLGLKIEVGFQDLISFSKNEFDFEQYFSRVISKSSTVLDLSIVLEKSIALKNTDPNLFQVCNGHDFVKALSQYIRETGEGKAIGDEIISSSLRMAYTFEHYKLTKLFATTKSWSVNNNCLLYT